MKQQKICDVFQIYIQSKILADLSAKSISDYVDFLKPFVTYCGDILAAEITDTLINAYISELLKRDISKSTRATYIRNVKIFLTWLSGECEVNYDYRKIHVPKSPKKNVRIYEENEIDKIFNCVRAESEWMVLRNKAILSLMLDSGIRQNEACTIERELVSLINRYVVVHGKGDKERVVPLGMYSIDLIQQYLEICPFKSKYLFVNRYGKPLTTNAVKQLVNKLSHELPFDLSSHKLRHNFATNYCIDHYNEYGAMDAYKLMVLMGHEDMETTKRYLHHATEIIASQEHLSHLDMIRKKKG